MAINYGLLRSLTVRQIVAALLRDGFYLRSSGGGSHQRYQHSDGRRVTVSFHKTADTLPPKTLKTIIEGQARWTEEDLKRLDII